LTFLEEAADLDRAAIESKAREYLRTPFRDHGRRKGQGVDCVGIVLCVGEELGLCYKDGRQIRHDDFLDYGRFPVLDQMKKEAHKVFELKIARPATIALAHLEPGDILIMRAPHQVHHMAIVTRLQGRPGMIHAYGSMGKVAEHIISEQWLRRIEGVFSYSGVTS
jgi:cell wall-associated NlpC family hydrolase